MGIPAMFSYIVKNYPSIIKKYSKDKEGNKAKLLNLEDSNDTFKKWKRRANEFLGN